MQKKAIVQRRAEALGSPNVQAEEAVEAMLTTITEALQQGEPVVLRRSRNFSQFVARQYWRKCYAGLHRLRANFVLIRRVSERQMPCSRGSLQPTTNSEKLSEERRP